MTTLKNPKLRFKNKNGKPFPDWENERLENIATLSKGKGVSKQDIVENGIPCIRYAELYTRYSEIIKEVLSQTRKSNKLVLSKKMDVIIPASGETAMDMATASCVSKSGIVLGSDLNIIRSKLNGYFLAYYLTHGKKKDIARLSQGISVIHLYGNQLRQLKINIPCSEEQERIVDALSTVDAKISSLRQKQSLLKEYKRGLMQKLFSRQLRFKDSKGKAFPDWEEKRLGEISKIYQPKTISQKEMIKDGKYPVFGANGIIGRYDKYNHEESEVLITCRGASCGTINLSEQRAWITGNAMVIKPFASSSNCETLKMYLFYLLQYENFRYIISGQAQPQIVSSALSIFKINIPCSKEQESIANALSAVDDKINAISNQVEKFENFKKGLLQQMFV